MTSQRWTYISSDRYYLSNYSYELAPKFPVCLHCSLSGEVDSYPKDLPTPSHSLVILTEEEEEEEEEKNNRVEKDWQNGYFMKAVYCFLNYPFSLLASPVSCKAPLDYYPVHFGGWIGVWSDFFTHFHCIELYVTLVPSLYRLSLPE